MSELRVAVVGGGPGGLVTAIALKRKGFKNVKVFERDSDATARKQGYSFTMFAPHGGLEFLEKLNLVEEVDTVGFQPTGIRFTDGQTGKVLMQVLSANVPEHRSRRILRAGLRKLLVDVCNREGVPIQWNAKFVGYQETDNDVTLRFEGLDPQTFDLVIGADGVHSGVRNQLVGDALLPCGYTSIMGILNRKDNPQVFEHPWMNAAGLFQTSPGVSVFTYHHPPDEIYFGVCTQIPHGELSKLCGNDKQKMKDEAVRLVSSMSQLAKDIIGSTPTEQYEQVLEFCDREPLKINKKTGRACNSQSGRITLLGDAAHPMMPFRAAGGNNALLDAWRLSDELSQLLSLETLQTSDITAALARYEQEMVSRSTPDVLGSRSAAATFHASQPGKIFLRNTILGMMNWKLNTYDTNKWVQWGIKGASISAVVAGGVALWKKIQG